MKNEEIVNMFRKALIDRKWSQSEFARRLGKSPSAISRRFADIDTVPFGELKRMANKLGLKITIGE